MLLLSRLAFVAPVSPLGVSLIDPLGAQGPPYGVSLSWFLFIHLVIILLLLSSFKLSYHVLPLLSRLAFVTRVAPLGVSLIDPLGGPRAPFFQPTVAGGWFSFKPLVIFDSAALFSFQLPYFYSSRHAFFGCSQGRNASFYNMLDASGA